jgi:predicted AlkP superfamily phosphohydrolase/phosphomutase
MKVATNNPQPAYLRQVVKYGVRAGFVAGFLWGVLLAGMGDLLPYPLDAWLFVLAISILTIVKFVILLFVIGFLCRTILAKKQNGRGKALFVARVSAFVLVVFPLLWWTWLLLNRPVLLIGFKSVLGGIALLFISVGVAVLLDKIIAKLQSFMFSKKSGILGKIYVWLPNYLILLFIVSAVLSLFAGRKTTVDSPLAITIQPKSKVLFLGVDAADFQLLTPLMEQGKLPNFSRLIKEGASGPLPTLISMYNPFANTITHGIKSAAIWNSILTGKTPRKHGIKDFVYTSIPFLSHPFRYPLLPSFMPARKNVEKMLGLKTLPFNRLFRKDKALWNIVSDAGLQAGVIGFWMTWPAERINGDVLSDRFDDPALPQRWFPQELLTQSQVDSFMAQVEHPSGEDLQYFTTFPFEPDYERKYEKGTTLYLKNDLVHNLVKSFYEDKFRSQLGLRLMDEHDYDFFAVYFYGLDTVGHAFTRYAHPQLFPGTSSEDVAVFGKIIEKYAIWIDTEIGKYLGKSDEQTAVILCSDHGMGPWTGARLKRKNVRLTGSHRTRGIAVLWGNHVKSGVRMAPKNVLDLMPTALYLLGLPVADDLDGHVLLDALADDFTAANPVERIATYETEQYKLRSLFDIGATQALDESMMQRLRALGYLK